MKLFDPDRLSLICVSFISKYVNTEIRKENEDT